MKSTRRFRVTVTEWLAHEAIIDAADEIEAEDGARRLWREPVNTSSPSPARSAGGPSNGELIRRLFALAWRYRLRCLQVLFIQLVLLTMGIFGLSLTGIGIDYIRRTIAHSTGAVSPGPSARIRRTLPPSMKL